MNNIHFEISKKDQLYYAKYTYVFKASLPYASTLRDIFKFESLNDALSTVSQRVHARERFSSHLGTGTKELLRRHDDIRQIATELFNNKDKFKLVVSVDWFYIYSNDINWLKDISNLPLKFYNKNWGCATVNRPKGTLIRPDSNYKFRSYFRFIENQKEVSELGNYLQNIEGEIALCSALKTAITDKKPIRDYHFIDYNDEKLSSLLTIIRPKSVRKTFSILKA